MILWFYALLFLIVLQAIKFFIYYQLIINIFSLNVYIYSLKISINNISYFIRIFKFVKNIAKIKDRLIRLILLKNKNRVIDYKESQN